MFKTLLHLLMLGWCCATAAHAVERLRVATEGAYPPFSFIDDQGQLAGFNVDIAHALCRRLGKECEIIAVSQKDLLPGLAAGRYQMIVSNMSKTPEREQWAEFTDPYYRTRDIFISRAGAGIDRVTPKTVRGKTLATQADTPLAHYLHEHYANFALIRLTDTLPAAFTALAQGEVDLVLSDNLSAFAFMRSDAGQNLDIVAEQPIIDELTKAARIQVHKGDIPFRDAINHALRDLWLDGAYHRISARYFPFDIY
ncbi:MAG: transporter substrate-binding domain-containing protein [Candidatus Contendobacter sp.]|nr:transporter substrate-binding domain-containing protein [Candidatus Contendobacter sp.]